MRRVIGGRRPTSLSCTATHRTVSPLTTAPSTSAQLDTPRFELTFAPPLPGADRTAPDRTAPDRRPADGVVVHRTSSRGPGGHPVYTDETGIIRAEISDRGEVRMLATSAHQRPRRPSGCHPLPAQSSRRAATCTGSQTGENGGA